MSTLVAQVLHDLDPDGKKYGSTVSYLPGDIESHLDLLVEDDTGMGCGFSVDASRSDQEVLYELADRLPTAFVELYAVGLPLVPGTQRPATPEIIGNAVVWKDPTGGVSWTCPVGQYEA
ncbi:hypothetical protein [Streptomyces lydicus]|uniref:hypothetical protein n=1 Tax=Streptomyces lydicus TaxID=47763 RepID=UPI0013DD8FBD|nr:hypothetical protein [Streptomyces lydicus]